MIQPNSLIVSALFQAVGSTETDQSGLSDSGQNQTQEEQLESSTALGIFPKHDHHIYLAQGRHPAHGHSSAGIATIPEDAAVVERDKSHTPPPHLAPATTTGTLTTPSSVGTSSGAVDMGRTGPDFVNSFTPPPLHSHHHHQQQQQQQQQGAGSATTWPVSYMTDPEDAEAAAEAPFHPDTTAIKLLVSNNVAGYIIGRAGQTISELQSESNTRIKLSQSGDYYPGTQDRVCLVQGNPLAVKVAMRLLVERLRTLQEYQHAPTWQQQGDPPPSYDFVVRLLVPLSCCGMIIGKSGSNIKFLEETSGVSAIRLSPKEESALVSTLERIVTVTGHVVENCLQCMYLVLDGMIAHPDISHYSNMTTSYANCVAPAVAYASASPGATSPSRHPRQPAYLPSSPASSRHSPPDRQPPSWEGAAPANSPFAQSQPPNFLTRRIASFPDLPGAMLSQRAAAQRLHHYQEENVQNRTPNADRMQIPQSSAGPSESDPQPLYLVPRYVSGSPPFRDIGFNAEGTADFQQQQQLHHHNHHHTPHRQIVPHSASAPDLLALQLEQSLRLAQPPPPPFQQQFHLESQPPPPQQQHDYNNSALVSETPTMIAPGCFTAQILVPDSMIGSILGRGGRALTELQMLSGTRVRISQRGEYMPGTRSRIVTVRGPTAQSVWQAQYMISQRVVLPPTATYVAA